MVKIQQQQLTESNTGGWDFFRQVMDLIYRKTGIRYHEVHIYRLLHKWGFKPKVPQKRFVILLLLLLHHQMTKRNSKKSKTNEF